MTSSHADSLFPEVSILSAPAIFSSQLHVHNQHPLVEATLWAKASYCGMLLRISLVVSREQSCVLSPVNREQRCNEIQEYSRATSDLSSRVVEGAGEDPCAEKILVDNKTLLVNSKGLIDTTRRLN